MNFCVKCKNTFVSETVRDRVILTKFLTPRVSAESPSDFSPKIVFPPFLAAILNFSIKCKNAFISEMERHRVILMKFLTPRVSAESPGNFSPKAFSRHFWRPSRIST